MVIREDRFYFGEAAFTGADISGRLTARGSWFRGQLETGYIGVHITQNFVDFDPQAESARRTLIGLEGVGLGWVTLQGEVSWKLLNFNLSFSQMFPYWERYRKDYQPLANRRLKGGWLAKMGFEYRIA